MDDTSLLDIHLPALETVTRVQSLFRAHLEAEEDAWLFETLALHLRCQEYGPLLDRAEELLREWHQWEGPLYG